MSLPVSELNGVKLYNLSSGKTLPEFLEEQKKNHKSLRYNTDFRHRIELIQDFNFPTSCNQIQLTKDQSYIIASGVYAPTIKIFDTKELSLKCLRGMHSEVVKFCILDESYGKLAFVCEDRTIELHAQYGRHFRTRIPKYPRNLVYNPYTCDLIISASSSEIYRLNLEEGQFLESFESQSKFTNALDYNEQLNILVSGGESGNVEYWDYRQREKVNIDVLNQGSEITEISTKGNASGLQFAVGSANGVVRVYDIRNTRRVQYEVRNQYRFPINGIQFIQNSRFLVSSNKKVIKINDLQQQKLFTNIENKADMNGFDVCKDTGLILVANDEPKIGAFFIPQLGTAPNWCGFLENLTEEMEEQHNLSVFEGFKFLTYEEIEKLNCANLIGTPAIKPHMHGRNVFLTKRVFDGVESIQNSEERKQSLSI